MIFPHQYFIGFSVSILIGVALSSISAPLGGLFFILATILIVILLPIPTPLKMLGIVCSVGILLGGARYHMVHSQLIRNMHSIIPHTIYTIEGRVTDEVTTTNHRYSMVIKIDHIDQAPISAYAELYGWGNANLKVGDHFTAKAKTLPLPDARNYLIRKQISARLELVEIIDSSTPPLSLKRELLGFRNFWAEQIKTIVPQPESQLINGLILGIRNELPQQLRDNLSRSGTTHIIALSGFNITIVILFMVSLLKFLPRKISLIASGIGILAFIVMTGLASSVVRAASMGWLLLLASIWGRRIHLGATLSLASATMVFINPFALQYDIGFQLSVVATAGLVFLGPIVQKLFAWIPWSLVGDTLATTLSATIATLPLTTYYFGGISIVGLITNLLVVPLVPFCMAGGALALLIGWLQPWTYPLIVLFYLPTTLLLKIVNFWGDQPWSYLQVSMSDPIWPVIFYSGIILVVICHAYIFPRHSQPD